MKKTELDSFIAMVHPNMVHDVMGFMDSLTPEQKAFITARMDGNIRPPPTKASAPTLGWMEVIEIAALVENDSYCQRIMGHLRNYYLLHG
jgi:hypothetical protein